MLISHPNIYIACRAREAVCNKRVSPHDNEFNLFVY